MLLHVLVLKRGNFVFLGKHARLSQLHIRYHVRASCVPCMLAYLTSKNVPLVPIDKRWGWRLEQQAEMTYACRDQGADAMQASPQPPPEYRRARAGCERCGCAQTRRGCGVFPCARGYAERSSSGRRAKTCGTNLSRTSCVAR